MKKIIFVELLHHHECFENPYLKFKDWWFETRAILWEYVAKQLKSLSKHKEEFFILKQSYRQLFSSLNWWGKIKYFFYEFWEIYNNIQQIKKIVATEKPDFLYLNTVESPFLVPLIWYLLQLKNVKLYLTIHNTNRLKVNFLKYFCFDFMIQKLINKSYRIVLLWEYLKFDNKETQAKVIYINNRKIKHTNVNKFDKISFVISWSLNYHNKDLESVFKWFSKFIKQHEDFKDKIQLVLLSKINKQVIEWIKEYQIMDITKTFETYISEDEMEKYLSKSHYAIISTYPESIYGTYTITGAFWDAVWFNLPILLSEHYAPGYNSNNIIRFQNHQLDKLLWEILGN